MFIQEVKEIQKEYRKQLLPVIGANRMYKNYKNGKPNLITELVLQKK